jgi:hypothetical protein
VVSDYLNNFCPDGQTVRNELGKPEIQIMCRRNIIFTAERIFRTWYLTIMSVLLTQYCVDDKIEKNEMGWACDSYGGGEGDV